VPLVFHPTWPAEAQAVLRRAIDRRCRRPSTAWRSGSATLRIPRC